MGTVVVEEEDFGVVADVDVDADDTAKKDPRVDCRAVLEVLGWFLEVTDVAGSFLVDVLVFILPVVVALGLFFALGFLLLAVASPTAAAAPPATAVLLLLVVLGVSFLDVSCF